MNDKQTNKKNKKQTNQIVQNNDQAYKLPRIQAQPQNFTKTCFLQKNIERYNDVKGKCNT